MIQNERQYRVTRAKAEKVRAGVAPSEFRRRHVTRSSPATPEGRG
jgi:hypothetical protein